MKENISTAGVQQYFSIRAQCIRSDSASRHRRHAGHAAAGERVVLFEKKVYNRDVVDAFGENVYRWGKSAGYCGGSVRS